MSRHVPKYCQHHNGQAYVYHKAIQNSCHRLYLGKYGSEESLRRYRQFLKRLELSLQPDELPSLKSDPSVLETVIHYDEYAKLHYKRPDGIAKEYGQMRHALTFLMEIFGDELACEIGPKSLRILQRHMVKRDYARSYINRTISRIKRFYRWASAEEIVPPEHYHKLLCVRGLQFGEMGVREAEKVTSACPQSVQGILEYLPPVVGAMVQVQYLCGMRPGEVCIMRSDTLKTDEEVWWYTPHKHKNEWRGHTLVKAIPKAAQEILRPFLQSEGEFLFSPMASWKHGRQSAESTRTTKRYPSEIKRVQRRSASRRRRKNKRQPGEHYTTQSYGRAVKNAFKKAAEDGLHLESFTPNQLRHAILSFITNKINQEAAQRYAGHEKLDTTSIYVSKNLLELENVARQLDAIWDA